MIDWSRLNELRDEVGADDFDEVVTLFVEEAEETIERLSPDATADALEADLHALKGSALNLGFSELAEICARGEKLAKLGDTSGIEFDEAKQSYAMSKAALMEKLGTPDAA